MTLSRDDQNAITRTAHMMADAARDAILPHFRNLEISADNKDQSGGFDPVTVADRAAERAMRDVLAQHRPDDGIFGEEYGKTPGKSGITWVLDPIDGTRAFISGAPVWGVLIAAGTETGPVFGIVDQPYIGERFVGGFGAAHLLRGADKKALSVRPCAALADSIMLSTFPEIGTEAEYAAFSRVAAKVQLTRYGLDCYGYALLAAGQVDLVIEAGLNAYDIQGPMAVVAAAGGIVTDWQGGPVHDGGQVLAAGDPAIHAAALALLNAA